MIALEYDDGPGRHSPRDVVKHGWSLVECAYADSEL